MKEFTTKPLAKATVTPRGGSIAPVMKGAIKVWQRWIYQTESFPVWTITNKMIKRILFRRCSSLQDVAICDTFHIFFRGVVRFWCFWCSQLVKTNCFLMPKLCPRRWKSCYWSDPNCKQIWCIPRQNCKNLDIWWILDAFMLVESWYFKPFPPKIPLSKWFWSDFTTGIASYFIKFKPGWWFDRPILATELTWKFNPAQISSHDSQHFNKRKRSSSWSIFGWFPNSQMVFTPQGGKSDST